MLSWLRLVKDNRKSLQLSGQRSVSLTTQRVQNRSWMNLCSSLLKSKRREGGSVLQQIGLEGVCSECVGVGVQRVCVLVRIKCICWWIIIHFVHT